VRFNDVVDDDTELWLFKVPTPDKFDLKAMNALQVKVTLDAPEVGRIKMGEQKFALCMTDPVEYAHLVNVWPHNNQLQPGKPFERMAKIVELFEMPPREEGRTKKKDEVRTNNKVLKVRYFPPGESLHKMGNGVSGKEDEEGEGDEEEGEGGEISEDEVELTRIKKKKNGTKEKKKNRSEESDEELREYANVRKKIKKEHTEERMGNGEEDDATNIKKSKGKKGKDEDVEIMDTTQNDNKKIKKEKHNGKGMESNKEHVKEKKKEQQQQDNEWCFI